MPRWVHRLLLTKQLVTALAAEDGLLHARWMHGVDMLCR